MCVTAKKIASQHRATVWHMLQGHNNNHNSVGYLWQQHLTVVYLFTFFVAFGFAAAPTQLTKRSLATRCTNKLCKIAVQKSQQQQKSLSKQSWVKSAGNFDIKSHSGGAEWSEATRGETKALRWHKNSQFPPNTPVIFRQIFVEKKQNKISVSKIKERTTEMHYMCTHIVLISDIFLSKINEWW